MYSFRGFGELNAKAADTTWYKRAIDQHSIEPDSFVFSVPFDSGYSDKINSTLVTATHAIFIEHRGHNKAPAAVVGLQFQHDSLLRHFKNITSSCTGVGNCRRTCFSDELECYLLDNNGFVILSESTEYTGKFFGHIDGTIMDSLVQDRIYRRVTLMDYQGKCSDRNNPYNGAGGIMRLTLPFTWLFNYVVSFATTWLTLLSYPTHGWPNYEQRNYIQNGEEIGSDENDDLDDSDDDDINYDDEFIEVTTQQAVNGIFILEQLIVLPFCIIQ